MLEIVYHDEYMVAVNKPHGLLIHRTKIANDATEFCLQLLRDQIGQTVYPTHRLDRKTSGVLVFAKNEKVKRSLQDNWAEFNKKYFAVVHGKLNDKEAIITSYLAENKVHRMYSVKDPEKGKLAKTGYKVLKASGKYSLLEIKLFTGRKNQIRVHLSEKGHPVVGDKMYGIPDKGMKRLGLHAASLTISHPLTNENMTFETEVPLYFKTLVNY